MTEIFLKNKKQLNKLELWEHDQQENVLEYFY